MTKPKKCKQCGKPFTPTYSKVQMVCSSICAIYYGRAMAKKKKEKEARQLRKEFNYQDRKWLNKKLQSEVNKIARLIDLGLPCLATGSTTGQMQGGHVYSRGAHTQMRFNLHNIHRQCAYSNNKQSHDGLMIEMLAEEYGRAYLDYLKDLRGSVVIKHTVEDLAEAYESARKFSKFLEVEGKVCRDVTQRIRLRNRANDLLGLYGSAGIYKS